MSKIGPSGGIAIVVTARPSYARVKTVLEALQHEGHPFRVYSCASALLPKYGEVATLIEQDGWPSVRILASSEHNTLAGTALTTAALTAALTQQFLLDEPSLVVTIADRKETLATAIAASYQHLPLFHLLSTERSGSIDDRVRAAVATLATYRHDPYLTGCPSVDLALRAQQRLPPVTVQDLGGVGSPLDLSRPFLVLLQHAVSSEPYARQQFQITVNTLCQQKLPVVAFWPGEEAGSDDMAKVLRELRESTLEPYAWHFVRSLAPERFYRLLTQCAVLVGNSSVGLREAGALGVPVVNLGTRQQGRRHDLHVLHSDFEEGVMSGAIARQVEHGHWYPSTLYGRGNAGKAIGEWLVDIDVRHRHGYTRKNVPHEMQKTPGL